MPEFDDVASDGHSPELQVSEWGNGQYIHPDTPDRQNLSEFYSNGITAPGAEVQGASVSGHEYQDNPQSNLADYFFPIAQDSQTMAE